MSSANPCFPNDPVSANSYSTIQRVWLPFVTASTREGNGDNSYWRSESNLPLCYSSFKQVSLLCLLWEKIPLQRVKISQNLMLALLHIKRFSIARTRQRCCMDEAVHEKSPCGVGWLGDLAARQEHGGERPTCSVHLIKQNMDSKCTPHCKE